MAKTLSAAAIQAKEIRAELKKAFPGVKFSVRTSNYSMGSSISVKWTDFPTRKAVEAITDKYKTVRYDEATGDILSGGNHFVFCSNEWTEETRQEIEKNMGEFDRYDTSYYYWFNRTAEEMESGEITEEAAETVEAVEAPEVAEIAAPEAVAVVVVEEAPKAVSEAVEAPKAASNVISFPGSRKVEKKERAAVQDPGKVVDMAYLKAEKEFKNLTPEQRLKLAVLTEKLGKETMAEAMARGHNIDKLFTFYAEKAVMLVTEELRME